MTDAVEVSGLDDVVVAAACAGDQDACAALWRTLAPTVTGYLRARGVEDPDGVTSDVFVTVLRRLGEARGVHGGAAGLRTFVFSVAHARVVDDARRRARHPRAVQFDPVRHDRPVASAENQALDATGDVGRLVAGLAADYREVLALRVVADLSLEQTAEVMQRSVGSVKQLQRRALLALRAAVAAADGSGEADTGSLRGVS